MALRECSNYTYVASIILISIRYRGSSRAEKIIQFESCDSARSKRQIAQVKLCTRLLRFDDIGK